MTLARRFVSFLSDYGHTDEFVGVCKSVMLSLAPDLQIIDITHDLPVHDVRAGALTLVRAAQYLPDGGIVQTLLGGRFIRAEVLWLTPDGKVQDSRLDRGIVVSFTTDSIVFTFCVQE